MVGRPGQVVGFGADGAAQAAQGWSNPNLLDNWYFADPVNQRGQAEYTAFNATQSASTCTIDRFKISATAGCSITCKVEDDGVALTVTPPAGKREQANFLQILAPNVLPPGVYTLSWLYSSDCLVRPFVFNGQVLSGYMDFPASDTPAVASIQLKITEEMQKRNTTFYMQINSSVEAHVKLYAAKVELGSQQTLAHQDAAGNWVLNDPPDYDLQYSLCSQYSPITGEWIGSQRSNPNLLDNWYFADPVNQRGKTEYTSVGYTIDRWRIWSIGKMGTVKIGNGITLTGEEGTSIVFDQQLDKALELYGKVATISILVGSVVGKFELQIANSFAKDFSEPGLISMTGVIYNAGKDGPIFRVFNNQPNSSCIIKAAKLELGPQQTLAHQDADGNWVLNDPPPNKALELLKCQRYYYKPGPARIRMSQYCNSGIWFFVPTPIAMRIRPTIQGSVGTVFDYAEAVTPQEGYYFSLDDFGPAGMTVYAMKTNNSLTDGMLYLSQACEFSADL